MDSITQFVNDWSGRGYEKGDTHTFWLQFLRDVLNVEQPEKYIKFEVPVKLKHTSFIDAFFPDSKVIIEQKSLDKNLDAVNAYEQAQRYGNSLPYSMRPRWIVTGNFKEFLIYDMETLDAPQKILLAELPQKFHAFDFLIDDSQNKIRTELELSVQAGAVVDKLYDTLKQNYLNPDNEDSLKDLSKLCVRLVFCLYAESAGIFGKHKIFTKFIETENDLRRGLRDLFKVLNTPENLRDPYDENLNIFPYVNGGLFDGNIELPKITPAAKDIILNEVCTFNWKNISPTIFGAVFESTINAKFRRKGGMHYTSRVNIHKVIAPLFLDALNAEFEQIKPSRNRKNLLNFQDKLSKLKFFDPACGSGNFLTETFISLRRLENKILRELLGAQIKLGALENPVKVSINQFYGVEINDFAVAVAKTALWISELQMLQETQEIIHQPLDFLPLKSYANIFEGNALRLDWNKIAPQVNFIMGNPPFVGTKYQTAVQKADILNLCKDLKPLDYVTGWFFKASQFMENNSARAAFVATNSITQGEQVTPLWKVLKSHIDFAHKTFKWDSESTDKAAVHCVVIGFSVADNPKPKIIFDGDKKIFAEHINGYLQDAPDIFIEKRKAPLDKSAPPMRKGNQPTDGGNLILSPAERAELLKKFPAAEKFIRRYMGADDLINGKIRYCLWLVDATPAEIKKIPPVYERVKKVREYRLNSSKAKTQKDAETPTLFQEIRQPQTDYLILPVVSSENRRYVPMDFVSKKIIANANAQMIPDATIYHFGILTSSVHMAWMRAICGRLESRYAYSASIVYNNFVWCQPTDEQRRKIEIAAQKILDARAAFPDSTLAELYDENLMPKILRDAHKENDNAVLEAYVFSADMTEPEIVSALMKLYKNWEIQLL